MSKSRRDSFSDGILVAEKESCHFSCGGLHALELGRPRMRSTHGSWLVCCVRSPSPSVDWSETKGENEFGRRRERGR